MTPTEPITASAAAAEQSGLHLAVLAASVRRDRISRTLGDWAAGRAAEVAGTVDLIDLAESELPDDGLLQPGGGPRSAIAHRIERADGYLVVTPEYNHSYPASLKRAIDWHYREWMFKPATVVSYGVHGGLLATEHLRGVLAELHVVTTRRGVGLRAPWNDVHDRGFDPPPGAGAALDQALGELVWWGEVLRAARRDRPFQP
ncbi:NADPH-dependent FMN reductase [Nocardioides pantholopis]|uniref:NADPH-dependent FMN reductase n=1 Tax=Nocardioides pantholopis TaxID=2483798 RepID=UPI000FDB162B|nr:NAD(P)H-dependent oxidoreductase [Nocardioides pantholopis]